MVLQWGAQSASLLISSRQRESESNDQRPTGNRASSYVPSHDLIRIRNRCLPCSVSVLRVLLVVSPRVIHRDLCGGTRGSRRSEYGMASLQQCFPYSPIHHLPTCPSCHHRYRPATKTANSPPALLWHHSQGRKRRLASGRNKQSAVSLGATSCARYGGVGREMARDS